MEEILKNYLDRIKIGGKQVYKNLALFPLLSNLAIPLEYLTLDEALADGLVEVTEKDTGRIGPGTPGGQQVPPNGPDPGRGGAGGGQTEPNRQHDDPDLLHCSIFVKTASENRIDASSKMARFSNRSRHRE